MPTTETANRFAHTHLPSHERTSFEPQALVDRVAELTSRLDDALTRIRNLEAHVMNLRHGANHAAD